MNEARKRRKAKQARRDAQRRTRVRQAEAPWFDETPLTDVPMSDETPSDETPSDETPSDETPLLDEVRQALDSHPLELLGIVSMLIEATKPDPFAYLPGRPQRETVDLSRLADSFVDAHTRETTVLLAVLGELLDDPDMRQRCRHEVSARRHSLPPWISGLAGIDVSRTVRRTHVLGDDDEIILGATLATGEELTCAAFIDHHTFSVVKDAFLIPDSIDTVVRTAQERNTDPDISLVDMDPADARAWLEHGLAQHPVFTGQSDTWPACRPLLHWLTRRLPTGGTPYQSPEWDSDDLSELCDEFFASAHGDRFTRRKHGRLLEDLLSEGDPLRWSVPKIEHLFRHGLRDSDEPLAVVLETPQLLKSFIPFAHARSGIRDELTAEALAAIDARATSGTDSP
ncbi:hypothetical protein [Mycolicibacterium poriferae]|uniref:hypothetical protein n=1 Tax=Mycolicibacterium poriferae TaxID=39694 RepID=UPI0024B931DE|nr:hypothetical protein [Mycolicibacterium poriferae]